MELILMDKMTQMVQGEVQSMDGRGRHRVGDGDGSVDVVT